MIFSGQLKNATLWSKSAYYVKIWSVGSKSGSQEYSSKVHNKSEKIASERALTQKRCVEDTRDYHGLWYTTASV